MNRQSINKVQKPNDSPLLASSNLFQRKGINQIGFDVSTLDRQNSSEQQKNQSGSSTVDSNFGHDFTQIPVRLNPLPIQEKLKVGQPNDKYEQEADRVAEQVVNRQSINNPPSKDSTSELSLAKQLDRKRSVQGESSLSPLGSATGIVQDFSAIPVRSNSSSVTIQPKLKIGGANDKYEQEADSIAARVVSTSFNNTSSQVIAKVSRVNKANITQAKCAACEKHAKEKEEILQRKVLPTVAASMAKPNVEQLISAPGVGSPLSMHVRKRIESVLATDLSSVRVHSDRRSQQAARDINAKAFTNQHHIYLGANQSSNDLSLMAHEATHTVQQGLASNQLQRQQDETEPEACTDEARASQSVAPYLMASGNAGGSFNSRLSRAEEREWEGLSAACQQDSEQCAESRSERISRLHGRIHAAMDAGAPIGTTVYAPIAGRVLLANTSTSSGYGNNILLQHDCPPATVVAGDRAVTSFYGHLDSMSVIAGQTVQPGTQVGTVGVSGRGQGNVREGMGAHLHFSVQAIPMRGGPTRVRREQTLFRGSQYEERADIRIHPRQWLRQLGVSVVATAATPTPSSTGASPPTPPGGSITTVQPKVTSNKFADFIGSDQSPVSAKLIQRLPLDETVASHGVGTLPYAEAQELYDCTNLLGEGSAEFCRQEVLGPPPVYSDPPSTALDAANAVQFSTGQGNFYRFPALGTHTNYTDRPQFQHPQSSMITYSGAGNNGATTVHPQVAPALNRLMLALRHEGDRLNDESMKQALIAVGYRGTTLHEGNLYLSALRRTITLNSAIFGTLTFPTALDSMARSELGFSGSPTHRAFQAAVAGQLGWNASLARQLVTITARYKAPRGGSTHHSGLVVDINFPYKKNSASSVEWHQVNRSRNADALRAAAGVWLSRYAMQYGFDSYDTSREIWHMEWRNWSGTTADPATP